MDTGVSIVDLRGEMVAALQQLDTNKVRLYRSTAGAPEAYPLLVPASSRSIRWDLIAQSYDQMIKHATAIRQGTASTEAILRRFTRNASQPTYQAMLEVGRAQRTIFVARYLRDRQLQREITEGLNVVGAFKGANAAIYYGKDAEIASDRGDEQEMRVACPRILQAALVYVNTLLLQNVLAEPECADLLTDHDRRGLTPVLAAHPALRRSQTRHDHTPRHPHRHADELPVGRSLLELLSGTALQRPVLADDRSVSW